MDRKPCNDDGMEKKTPQKAGCFTRGKRVVWYCKIVFTLFVYLDALKYRKVLWLMLFPEILAIYCIFRLIPFRDTQTHITSAVCQTVSVCPAKI